MENVIPEWHEPFPEPQTIPLGWDLSEILSAPMSAAMDADESAED
jgi:hypothetical protein